MADTERLVQYKLFTPEEANASLPLVRAIASDLSRLCREVVERRQRLSFLRERQPREGRDPYQEELSQIEEDLQADAVRMQEYVAELRQLGVEPKSALDGLIDFPAMLDGRLVYLCWKLGEPEVLYWHELEAGFQGRHPLSEKVAAFASRT
jgi:hypothetical protein